MIKYHPSRLSIVVASPLVLIYLVAPLSDGEKITCDPFDPNDPMDEASEIVVSRARTELGGNHTNVKEAKQNQTVMSRMNNEFIKKLSRSISLLQK